MRSPATIVTDYVLAKLDGEPVAKRAELYRALAGLAAPTDQKIFAALAADCDAISNAHDQFVLNFKRRARG